MTEHRAESRSVRVVRKDGTVQGSAVLLREHRLAVTVNGQPLFSLACTNSDLAELTAGRLLTEGIIRSRSDLQQMEFSPDCGSVSVLLRENVRWKGAEKTVPTACTDNRSFAAPAETAPLRKLPAAHWEPEWIFSLAERFSEGTTLHRMTQGAHSCFLARGGALLYVCEDIGRHNAVDKAVGYALMQGVPRGACILFSSGRVPVDMVRKVVSAGIPVLATKSVATAESVTFAREYGLTLICRAYPDQFEVC